MSVFKSIRDLSAPDSEHSKASKAQEPQSKADFDRVLKYARCATTNKKALITDIGFSRRLYEQIDFVERMLATRAETEEDQLWICKHSNCLRDLAHSIEVACSENAEYSLWKAFTSSFLDVVESLNYHINRAIETAPYWKAFRFGLEIQRNAYKLQDALKDVRYEEEDGGQTRAARIWRPRQLPNTSDTTATASSSSSTPVM